MRRSVCALLLSQKDFVMPLEEAQGTTQAVNIAIRKLLRDGLSAALITVVRTEAAAALAPLVGSKLIVTVSGDKIGSFGDQALDNLIALQSTTFLRTREDTKLIRLGEIGPHSGQFGDLLVLFERIETEPRLVIAGAGHVGASLARLAALVRYRVTLIDDRPEFVERALFASMPDQNIELVAAANWSDSLSEAVGNGRRVAVAIVTRGHKQDEECLRAAVAAQPDYIGMIGSKRRTNIVLAKLGEEGVDKNGLQRVRAPIGLDLGATSPEEVALAILAEIVAEHRGGSGAPLSTWRRPSLAQEQERMDDENAA